MQPSDVVPIVFHGGSYGTYLEWLLTTCCSNNDIVCPFTKTGSSHGFKGNHLDNINGWEEYLFSGSLTKFVRFHPKTQKNESVSDNLDRVLSKVDKMIYLYPDEQSKLLVINNFFYKIWNNWWHYQFQTEIDKLEIFSKWPIDKSVAIEDIPVWIQREFLSFYLLPAWHDQVDWYHPDHWQREKCLILNVSDLLNNVEHSLNKIQKFCNLHFQKTINEIQPFHQLMLKLQKNLGQDQLCKKIVEYTINGYSFDWDSIPLPSQSWIQWELRNQGFEIECHGLDIFPTNSIQLKKLLYNL